MNKDILIENYLEELYIEEGILNVVNKFSKEKIIKIMNSLKTAKDIESIKRIFATIPKVNPDKVDKFIQKKHSNYFKIKNDAERELKNIVPDKLLSACSRIAAITSVASKDPNDTLRKFAAKVKKKKFLTDEDKYWAVYFIVLVILISAGMMLGGYVAPALYSSVVVMEAPLFILLIVMLVSTSFILGTLVEAVMKPKD